MVRTRSSLHKVPLGTYLFPKFSPSNISEGGNSYKKISLGTTPMQISCQCCSAAMACLLQGSPWHASCMLQVVCHVALQYKHGTFIARRIHCCMDETICCTIATTLGSVCCWHDLCMYIFCSSKHRIFMLILE